MKKALIISGVVIFFFCTLVFVIQKYKEPAYQMAFSLMLKVIASDIRNETLKNYNSIEYKHFTLHYSDQDKNLLPLTKAAINRGIELNSKFIGSYSEPNDIVLFKTSEEMDSVSGLDHASGFHSMEMNMTGIVPEDREALANGSPPVIWEYNKTVMHEYTHFVMGHKFSELGLSLEDIPYWFNEGFAEYIGNEEMSITIMEQERLPLKEVTTAEQWRNNRLDSNYNIYLQSYIAVRHLIHTYGDTVILDLLNETQATKDFNSAFKNVTEIEIDDFDYYDENDLGG
ncbi:collagenase [Planomicrobium soli]|uniref:Collagenase n=1 Tax=Planomicrobium soli TaxID=1176648 RepID=A0A2P8H4B3_9BACL|nr:collagenase [Planomicrobium soli]PSL41039.1 collagenase [Planomicrobium soli]